MRALRELGGKWSQILGQLTGKPADWLVSVWRPDILLHLLN